MKNKIDSKFAIAILILVASCLGFAFWLHTFNISSIISHIPSQNIQKKDEKKEDQKKDQGEESMQYYFGIQERSTQEFDGPHLFLSVITEKEFPCSNFGIEHSMSVDESTVKITFGEIIYTELCLTALGPASFSEELNLSKGLYTLEFHNKEKVDKYSLDISTDTVSIKSFESTFTKTEQTTNKRTPKNLLRADCYYNSTWTSDPKDDYCEKFFSEIETFAEPFIVAEEGRKPKNQFYHFDGRDEVLVDLINKYDRDGHYIKLATSEGKSFICPFHCIEPGVAHSLGSKIEYLKEERMDVSICEGNSGCIMEVAFNRKDEKICEQLSEKNHGQC